MKQGRHHKFITQLISGKVAQEICLLGKNSYLVLGGTSQMSLTGSGVVN